MTLISLDDGGEWMVVTPQGLFDGTPAAWNQILWRYNQDTFNVAPIEWFFNEFYHPGLLSDIVAGKRPRVAQDVSKKDRRQPQVKLSLIGEPAPATGIASRRVKVKIDVTDAPADKEHSQGHRRARLASVPQRFAGEGLARRRIEGTAGRHSGGRNHCYRRSRID